MIPDADGDVGYPPDLAQTDELGIRTVQRRRVRVSFIITVSSAYIILTGFFLLANNIDAYDTIYASHWQWKGRFPPVMSWLYVLSLVMLIVPWVLYLPRIRRPNASKTLIENSFMSLIFQVGLFVISLLYPVYG